MIVSGCERPPVVADCSVIGLRFLLMRLLKLRMLNTEHRLNTLNIRQAGSWQESGEL